MGIRHTTPAQTAPTLKVAYRTYTVVRHDVSSYNDTSVQQQSDSAVSWSSGTKTIFCAQPAEKAVFLDASGDLTLTGANYNIVFDKSDDALEFADNAKATFGDSAGWNPAHWLQF